MNRAEADAQLQTHELVPCIEGTVSQAREMERQLLEQEIPALMAAKPKGACCGGGCGCAGKVQLLVRPDDLQKVSMFMKAEWIEAVRRESGVEALVTLTLPEAEAQQGEVAELKCPACGFAGELVSGACGDCGLQLE